MDLARGYTETDCVSGSLNRRRVLKTKSTQDMML